MFASFNSVQKPALNPEFKPNKCRNIKRSVKFKLWPGKVIYWSVWSEEVKLSLLSFYNVYKYLALASGTETKHASLSPWRPSQTRRELCCEISSRHHHRQPFHQQHWELTSGILHSGVHKTTCCPSTEPTEWFVDFRKKGCEDTHTGLHWWSWGGGCEKYQVPENHFLIVVVTHTLPGEGLITKLNPFLLIRHKDENRKQRCWKGHQATLYESLTFWAT